jgi:RNA polymerase sigma-70 factor, ECF subfamily
VKEAGLPHDPEPLAAAGSVELARGVARGDREALARFYEAWFDRVFVAARRVTGRDEAFCLDVVQEVMVKVARKLRPVKSEEELERWMLRVVRTTCVDLLRREARRSGRERRAVRVAAAESPPARLAEAEAAAWVRVAAAASGDSELLRERVVRGRTLEEIGAASGMTAGAVHGRVRRALARMGRSAREKFHE